MKMTPTPEDPDAKAAVDAATILEQTKQDDGSLVLRVADGTLKAYDPQSGDTTTLGMWSDEPSETAAGPSVKIPVQKFDDDAAAAPASAETKDSQTDYGLAGSVAIPAVEIPASETNPVAGLMADTNAKMGVA